MIEEVLLNYLNASSLSVKAYAQRPETEPESYVIIQKTGSERTKLVDTATIAIQSFAESLYKAAQLNEEIKALMDGLAGQGEIGGVHLVTDYNFTSPTAKRYRYQAVYNITHY